MLQDIWTIIWKEKESITQSGGNRGKLWPFIFIAVFGIVMPLQMGEVWLTTPVGVAFWVFIPIFVVSTLVADSFAGERERHTLETLLASRLSDTAILLGKIAAVVAYGWGMSVLAALISLITANVVVWEGTVRLYSLEIGVGGLVLSLLVAILASTIGAIVSLRAATARQAQQIVGMGVFAIVWIPILALNFLPEEWKASIVQFVMTGDVVTIALAFTAMLVIADIILFGLAMARFQRSKLILD